MLIAQGRVERESRPALHRDPVLDVVMLGHCPGSARWDRLAADEACLREIDALGLAASVARLKAGHPEARGCHLLPIPLRSLGQFQALFPEAFSGLVSNGFRQEPAWLPLAVQDFFEATEQVHREPLRLWIIRIPEAPDQDPQSAFLPNPGADFSRPDTLGAFDRALLIPQAAILTLPDLERLRLPAFLPAPSLQVPNTMPGFLPCASHPEDALRERNPPLPPLRPQPPVSALLSCIAGTLARRRPDMVCLLAAPIAVPHGGERPVPDPGFLQAIANLQHPPEGDLASPAGFLRHLQLVYPYLQGEDRAFSTPCGLVAGMQALVSQRVGPWRSIAGQPMPTRCTPWPPLPPHRIQALRDTPGITLLVQRGQNLKVDDERLAGPCLRGDGLTQAHWNDPAYRSVEVARFMGWIHRQLRALGERLVFDADPRDPRPGLLLRDFFTSLHALGALRGAQPEDAFQLRPLPALEMDTLGFEIELAPAFPIDRIRVTFLQDRHSGPVLTLAEA